mmetsp:Transcript_5938/g.6782  ORF Transcript_5938/g.6782 Transcript_5938/m.6782 type:complete len:84 (-) Transcript_5938:34-285(-)
MRTTVSRPVEKPIFCIDGHVFLGITLPNHFFAANQTLNFFIKTGKYMQNRGHFSRNNNDSAMHLIGSSIPRPSLLNVDRVSYG